MNNLTLGSLFDGSGGFPLGGILCGIKPVWSAEIEPFPVLVTRKRLPQVKHYGDVSQLNGSELEPVDILTWGSPCQGLSVAGKRKGLEDDRSGLYVQAVRIAKEMLEATDRKYPKFCVFENVPGLLSSNKGNDFVACLDMMQSLGFLPDPSMLDAQDMGVPQRRKRVYITWVNVDYILSKKTNLSRSIALQLHTEILQTILEGLSKISGEESKKSTVRDARFSEDGLKKRIDLFSLQEETHLLMLQNSLDETQAKYGIGQKRSDRNSEEDRVADSMLTATNTKHTTSITGSPSGCTEWSLKHELDEALGLLELSTTSTLTEETISRKTCFYVRTLLNTLDSTIRLMQSQKDTDEMRNQCYEWVLYTLIWMEEFINAKRKHNKGANRMEWDDCLRFLKSSIPACEKLLVTDLAGESAGEVLFKSEGVSGYTPQGFRAWKRAAGGAEEGAGETSGRPDAGSGRYCLNVQGQIDVSVTEDQVGTLIMQDHGNHPAILQSAGFSTEHSAQSRSIGYEEEVSPTLRAGVVPAAMMFDNHAQDCRYEGPMEQSPTVTARYGTGGNNTPIITELEPVTLKIRSGCEGGGKGPIQQVNKSATLGTHNDQTLFQPMEDKSYSISRIGFNGGMKAAFNFAVNEEVSPTLETGGVHTVANPEIKAYGVCSKSSHSMLSNNPKSGFYEAETSRTLDQGGGNPTCNQGGICIVAPVPEKQETFDVRFTSEEAKNSRVHCYKTNISRCLDTSEANPDGNHRGIAVVRPEPVAFTQNQRDEVRDLDGKSGALQAQPGMKQQTYVLQGSMIGREDKNGPQGDGINEDVSFTLNTVDRHAVAAPSDEEHATWCAITGSFMTVDKEKTPPLMARDYKDPQIINDTESAEEKVKPEPMYIVRRLTPVECARLQGFPDWWCEGLSIPDPTDEELAFWTDVWETWRKLTNPKGKPKTEKQIRKWLTDPYTDAAEYKLWGNGVALPCVYHVLFGIKWFYSHIEKILE